MVEWLCDILKGKSIVLLGFGREGESSYRLIRSVFPDTTIAVADRNESVRNHPALRDDPRIVFLTGTSCLDSLGEFDTVVRSPGIAVWNLSLPAGKITSQTDLFLRFYGKKVTGVTGTKGKSTTSSLIHHIFKTAGEDSILAGNIGNPPFNFISMIAPSTHVVMELSSHQLEYLHRGPHTGVLLNLFPEHLDAYQDFIHYQQAKMNIARFQEDDDSLVYAENDPLVRQRLDELRPSSHLVPFAPDRMLSPGCYISEGKVLFDDGNTIRELWQIHQERFLRGEHNLRNILAAATAVALQGIPAEAITEGIATFKGLEHRLEYIGEIHDIHFYDDSISTIPEACIEAVRSIPGVDTLVAGGFDRGIPYEILASFLMGSEVRNLILVGAAGRRIGGDIERLLKKGVKPAVKQKIFYINRFDDFAPIVFRETRKGGGCLLSPAAASYDEFRNFEERGKRFRDMVFNYEERRTNDE